MRGEERRGGDRGGEERRGERRREERKGEARGVVHCPMAPDRRWWFRPHTIDTSKDISNRCPHTVTGVICGERVRPENQTAFHLAHSTPPLCRPR